MEEGSDAVCDTRELPENVKCLRGRGIGRQQPAGRKVHSGMLWGNAGTTFSRRKGR